MFSYAEIRCTINNLSENHHYHLPQDEWSTLFNQQNERDDNEDERKKEWNWGRRRSRNEKVLKGQYVDNKW